MAADKRGGSGKSFGVGWLQDQLRARFDIRGPIGEPWDVEGKVQVGMEARPSLPWEYGNARWLPVAGQNGIGAGGAGTFSSISFSCAAASLRTLVITKLSASGAAIANLSIFVNQAFVAGNVGFGIRDGRFVAGASWLTPVPDAASIAQNVAVALPPATSSIVTKRTLGNTNVDLLTDGDFIIVPAGATIAVFNETANDFLWAMALGFLVPTTDIT